MYLGAVVIDVNDLDKMRRFWAPVLGYEAEVVHDHWIKLCPPGGLGANVSLQLVPEKKEGKNRLHLDLYSEQPEREVARIEALGATVVDRAHEKDFTVLSDPEGNLFCVIDKAGQGG